MTGTISISHNGQVVQQLFFDSDYRKKIILNKWKKMYGKGFNNAEIEVITEDKNKKCRPN